jgi:hypothetical protein
MTDRLRVVVCGYLVRGPLGGIAWHHLQYVLGLHRMGHDVTFAEDSDDYESCYDPSTDTLGTDPSFGLEFAADAFDRLGLGDRWAYYDQHGRRWRGPLGGDAPARLGAADVLLDVSGVNPPRPWWDTVPVRVLIDTDPVFTQLRHLGDGHASAPPDAHTHFFTYAENVGRGAKLPDDGLPWRPTRQPVVLDAWPVAEADPGGAWTTLMQWDSYAERHHEGVAYGMKSRSFDGYLDLPSRVPGERLELAVGAPPETRELLRGHGWRVLDPLETAPDPWTYQRFLRASKGEFSVAKHGYVVSRSGWFSERTAGYLASGRPAVVQDTGFSSWLPCGDGVVAVTDADEAVAAIAAVGADYGRHCRAARELVAEHFGHERVLAALLAGVGR